jgi:lysophospholipase L1-like esterase
MQWRRILAAAALSSLFALTAVSGRAADVKPEDAKDGKNAKAKNTAVIPVPRAGRLMEMHEGFVEQAKAGGADVLFLGDSITDAWGGKGHNEKAAGTQVFAKEFGPLKTVNFGIGGDRTQHVLWRLQNGELGNYFQPKVVMLMIGTNNSRDNSAEEIAEGIKADVSEIHKLSPKTKVLLLAVFPRGEKPNPQREKLKRVNEIIAKLDDGGKTVKFLDIGDKFLPPSADGVLSKEIMPDFLHLSPKGYQIWADAVKGPIKELLAN